MYGDKHIYFLQHVLHLGCLELNEALSIINVLNEDEEERNGSLENELKLIVNEINNQISPQKLKIQLSLCEVTGKEFVILVNLSHDPVYKFQTSYKPLELEYFQALLNEIVQSREKNLKQLTALNISTTLTGKLSHTVAENLLMKWFEGGYFVQKNGCVHLGVRCIQEYMSYFVRTFKDHFQCCNLCSEVTLLGKSCFYCRKTMHEQCLEKFFKKQQRCPNCKNEWREATERANNETIEADSDSSSDENNESMREEDEEEEDSIPKPRKIRKKN